MLKRKAVVSGLITLLMSILAVSSPFLLAEKVNEDIYFAPLPSFERMFSALDYLEVNDFSMVLEKENFKVEEEVFKVAFALGVNTAEALLATKAREAEALHRIAREMFHYSRFLGLSDEILKLGDELQQMVGSLEWEVLESSLEKYKEAVEIALYQSRQYDMFTMMQLGGWTHGLNRITNLLSNNYNKEKSSIVNQKGIVNSLISNLKMVRSDRLKNAQYYHTSTEVYKHIREILYSYEDSYPPDAIEELHNLTEKIRVSFR